MNCCKNLILLLAVFTLFSCKNNKVTLEHLLDEMIDKAANTHFPENYYTLKQFSSYDRKSLSPDSAGWFANADYTQFIRTEDTEDRREFVLFDAEGPGALVRWWMTFAGEGASEGIVRIYIDGNPQALVEKNILEVLSGTFLCGAPLASSVSPETEYQRRGHNLYLPIPYSKSCKITYECDAVKFENNRWKPSIYYNINYRTYSPDVVVESFSMEDLKRLQEKIEACNTRLLKQETSKEEVVEKSRDLGPNDPLSITFKERNKALSKIRVKINAPDIHQALRSTVLSISFDNHKTVWVPVGDFFGTGYEIQPSETWYTKVNENGWMESTWIMPFKKSAEISLINYDQQTTEAELEVYTDQYKWQSSSMYFGASWKEYNRIHTATDPELNNHLWHFDVNYVDLKGSGIYVGDALTIFNTVDAWWGEGDEKIYVDGEKFPSSIGTGTEDYYGYAWCRPEKFSHPFIAQPTGAGNFHPGMTVNMRYRSLDAIPFRTEISSNIELWHWVKTKMNYAQSAFWYAKPGFSSNVKEDPEAVKMPVARKRSDIYPPVPPLVDENGKIEGENLEIISCESGTANTQSGSFGWSNESQLWWRNGNTGDELVAKFILEKEGKYNVSAMLTKAVDYGIIQIRLNGNVIGQKFNGYTPTGVIPQKVKMGKHHLQKGDNTISFSISGSDKNAKPGNMAGIDYLVFETGQ